MRSSFGPSGSTNKLLEQLPPADLEALRPHLTRVRLVNGQVLVERGSTAEHVFFIEDGIASLNADTESGGAGVQVAMIGREGMAGGLALLNAETAAFGSVVMQIPGPAMRIRVADLASVLDEYPMTREVCLGYVQILARQIMGTAAGNARDSLAERCVRWLLMAHERVDGDDIPVTHEALSTMLGVRRSGITVATTALQRAGLIQTGRGRIRILDRGGLQGLAMPTQRNRNDNSGADDASDADPASSDSTGVKHDLGGSPGNHLLQFQSVPEETLR